MSDRAIAVPREIPEDEQPLLPFMLPRANHLNPMDGTVHCIARREGRSRNDRIVFYLEGTRHREPATPLFVAQKQTDGKFYIFNISDDASRIDHNFKKSDPAYLGKIQRKPFITNILHANTLFLGTKETKRQVASTVYEVLSLVFPVVDGCPNRIAHCIIRHKADNDDNEEEDGDEEDSIQYAPPINEMIRFHHTHIPEIGNVYSGLHVFQSNYNHKLSVRNNREPFVMRFHGRVSRASAKNLQIRDPANDEVIIQMGRWNNEEFTVDFKAPYNAYQAFGFALAQLEA